MPYAGTVAQVGIGPDPKTQPAGHLAPPEASTGYLLAQAGGHSRRLFGRVLADFQVSAHHLGVLMALSHLGPTSQQRVSAMVGVDPRNTTPLVDALAARGLLARGPDPDDRRRHLLELTDAGRVLLDDLVAAGHVLEDELFGGLTADERVELHRMLLVVLGPASPWARPAGLEPATVDLEDPCSLR